MRNKRHWDLRQWLADLEQRHAHQPIVLGLERICAVGNRLGVLTFPCPVVMVGGTNGKGSTVASLAILLLHAGLKVATYTSPHLLRFNERIQIAGSCVTDEQLCAAFLQVAQAQKETELTFFEFTTLAAFVIFQQAHLDLIILEVGMGGRLDAVNVIDPQLAIVTSIGYDHQAFLGNTLAKIALEKAGIFRPGIPILVGKQAQIASLIEHGQKLKSFLHLEGEAFCYQAEENEWHFQREVIKLPTHFLPISSVSLALAAYTILGNSHFPLPPLTQIVSSLERMMMIGRCQELEFAGKHILLDVGHNGQASQWLSKRLKVLGAGRKKIAVWASLADKSLAAIVKPLVKMIDTWLVGELPGNTRSSSCQTLSDPLIQHGITQIYAFPDIKLAFAQALTLAKSEDMIVVFGSFYVVSKIYEQFLTAPSLHQNGLFYKEITQHSSAGQSCA